MIIAFTGNKRVGKTTAAQTLIRALGKSVVYSFAKPLKAGVQAFFGFDEKQINGKQKDIVDERYGITPREVLQIFGTELMQYKIHELLPELDVEERNFWCKRFEIEYERLRSLGVRHIVIDDLRFPHEEKKVRELGGIVVRIERSDLEEHKDEHPSETEMSEIDADKTIISDGDLLKFKRIIRKLGNEIRNWKR